MGDSFHSHGKTLRLTQILDPFRARFYRLYLEPFTVTTLQLMCARSRCLGGYFPIRKGADFRANFPGECAQKRDCKHCARADLKLRLLVFRITAQIENYSSYGVIAGSAWNNLEFGTSGISDAALQRAEADCRHHQGVTQAVLLKLRRDIRVLVGQRLGFQNQPLLRDAKPP